MTAITSSTAAGAPTASWLAAPHPPSLHYPTQRDHSHYYHSSTFQAPPSSYASSSTTASYHTTTFAPFYPTPAPHQRISNHYTPEPHPAPPAPPAPVKRRRLSTYANVEAQQAAKLLQKAKRREQNRNAQRRLRDRKEEHIFKLEGQVTSFRRQSKELKSQVEGLEGLVRRLVEEREVLLARLEGGERTEVVGGNALGLIDVDTSYGRHFASNSRSSSMSDSTSSASITTPKTPTTLFHSPLPIEYGRSKMASRRAASPTLPLPRIKSDPLPTSSSADSQRNIH